jgi:methylated-DNA-[protein]-cysteine S-methyltransferase
MTEATIDATAVTNATGASASRTAWTACDSPLGNFTLEGDGQSLRRIYFPSETPRLPERERDRAALAGAQVQLEQYFAGELRTFELELEPNGTPLQLRVWRALQQIPYGQTTTYGAIADELGLQGSEHEPPARIVGSAIARTPIPIVIPCHRVLAADGALRGYRGGLETKRALLDFEASGGLRAALAEGWERDQLSLL